MAHGYDTMMTPVIEDLLERTESKFVLVSLAAKRSREITDYYGQLGVGIGALVPPQVTSTSSTALSIALEEIAVGKIEAIEVDPNAPHDDLEAAHLTGVAGQDSHGEPAAARSESQSDPGA